MGEVKGIRKRPVQLKRDGFWLNRRPVAHSLRLSRLRGRPDRIEDTIRVGENSLHSTAVNRDAPTPALPPQSGEGAQFLRDPIQPDLITL